MKNFDVELKNIVKTYGEVIAVDNLSLRVESGSFLTLLGPSGCGKTTTLRIIGGFETLTSGEVCLRGKKMTNEPPFRRDTNMVFQDYALFPHKTVSENIGFGMKMKRANKAKIEARVQEMLDLIHLPEIFDRMPDQLSGGQRQRVALARALILKPSVLLLDEPLGALDAKIRKQLQLELKQLQRELGITFIYVTHDQEEAMTMSDTIAIMNKGRLEQLGSPEEIYNKPKTRFVAQFVGECNLLPGEIIGHSQDMIEMQDAKSRIFRLKSESSESIDLKSKTAYLAVRPEDIVIGDGAKFCANRLQGKLKERLYKGSIFRTIIEVDENLLTVDAKKETTFAFLDNIQIGWNQDAGWIITE